MADYCDFNPLSLLAAAAEIRTESNHPLNSFSQAWHVDNSHGNPVFEPTTKENSAVATVDEASALPIPNSTAVELIHCKALKDHCDSIDTSHLAPLPSEDSIAPITKMGVMKHNAYQVGSSPQSNLLHRSESIQEQESVCLSTPERTASDVADSSFSPPKIMSEIRLMKENRLMRTNGRSQSTNQSLNMVPEPSGQKPAEAKSETALELLEPTIYVRTQENENEDTLQRQTSKELIDEILSLADGEDDCDEPKLKIVDDSQGSGFQPNETTPDVGQHLTNEEVMSLLGLDSFETEPSTSSNTGPCQKQDYSTFTSSNTQPAIEQPCDVVCDSSSGGLGQIEISDEMLKDAAIGNLDQLFDSLSPDKRKQHLPANALDLLESPDRHVSIPRTSTSIASDDIFASVPQLTTVSMFWNTFPALIINDEAYVRLVDINKQALPGMDVPILRSKCRSLGISVKTCTEKQRDFLIQYAYAIQSRSCYIVSASSARELISACIKPADREANKQKYEKTAEVSRVAATVEFGSLAEVDNLSVSSGPTSRYGRHLRHKKIDFDKMLHGSEPWQYSTMSEDSRRSRMSVESDTPSPSPTPRSWSSASFGYPGQSSGRYGNDGSQKKYRTKSDEKRSSAPKRKHSPTELKVGSARQLTEDVPFENRLKNKYVATVMSGSPTVFTPVLDNHQYCMLHAPELPERLKTEKFLRALELQKRLSEDLPPISSPAPSECSQTAGKRGRRRRTAASGSIASSVDSDQESSLSEEGSGLEIDTLDGAATQELNVSKITDDGLRMVIRRNVSKPKSHKKKKHKAEKPSGSHSKDDHHYARHRHRGGNLSSSASSSPCVPASVQRAHPPSPPRVLLERLDSVPDIAQVCELDGSTQQPLQETDNAFSAVRLIANSALERVSVKLEMSTPLAIVHRPHVRTPPPSKRTPGPAAANKQGSALPGPEAGAKREQGEEEGERLPGDSCLHPSHAQPGRIFLHLYTSLSAPCIQCATCKTFYSVASFLTHLHQTVFHRSRTIPLATAERRQYCLYTSDPSPRELELWVRFQILYDYYQERSELLQIKRETVDPSYGTSELKACVEPGGGPHKVLRPRSIGKSAGRIERLVLEALNHCDQISAGLESRRLSQSGQKGSRKANMEIERLRLVPLDKYALAKLLPVYLPPGYRQCATPVDACVDQGDVPTTTCDLRRFEPAVEFSETRLQELEARLTPEEILTRVRHMGVSVSPIRHLTSSCLASSTKPIISSPHTHTSSNRLDRTSQIGRIASGDTVDSRLLSGTTTPSGQAISRNVTQDVSEMSHGLTAGLLSEISSQVTSEYRPSHVPPFRTPQNPVEQPEHALVTHDVRNWLDLNTFTRSPVSRTSRDLRHPIRTAHLDACIVEPTVSFDTAELTALQLLQS